ncbi:MAG: hypothetical protein D6731_23590 [Planctomycetota bacterium]|nr:MAG: hypothetical protein D6731_23590 [Planctomycetota bacterium]
MTPLDKARFQQFLKQAKGMRLNEVTVSREDKKRHAVLKYSARSPKGSGRLGAEWRVPREGRDEAEVTEDVKAFLATLRKHFFVRRGAGLEGEVYADEAMEAKATPIKKA